MAETLYPTPAFTPPLSPVQAPRKRKTVTNENIISVGTTQSEKAPRSRVPKTNQTKSRNGCHTCKAKRLKCDETKPTCNNCSRRNVECEGYKKEFKWKDFPEQNIGRRLTKSGPVGSYLRKTAEATDEDPDGITASLRRVLKACDNQAFEGLLVTEPQSTSRDGPSASSPSSFSELSKVPDYPQTSEASVPMGQVSGFANQRQLLSNASASPRPDTHTQFDEEIVAPGSLSQSIDPIMDPNNTAFPHDLFNQLNLFGQPSGNHFDASPPSTATININEQMMPLLEFPRQDNGARPNGVVRSPEARPCTQPPSQISPQMDISPPGDEILVHRFFTSTCSVMSIFPRSNESTSGSDPWKHVIWPLVRQEQSPMLYHALMSMACFQNYQAHPTFLHRGTEHMRKSIEILIFKQQWMHASIELTLATCIALAFAESWMSWKQMIKSGSSFIKTAKQCLMHALQQGAKSRAQKKQLRFLCKTYLYTDVIARLTSVDEDVQNDAFDGIAAQVLGLKSDVSSNFPQANPNCLDFASYSSIPGPHPAPPETQLDPLMGCASTLFPVIGRVANLVRRVYRNIGSHLSIISEAQVLKSQLQAWKAPSAGRHVTELHEHARLTAEAYRFATLLHLYQSIPELLLPSQSLPALSAELGMRILSFIARIPPSSGTITVHIYPLLVGSCEAKSEDDRQWIRSRWGAMEARMGIGNVEKAREVVEDVWSRRDIASNPMTDQHGSSAGLDECLLDAESLSQGLSNDEFSFDDLFGSNIGSVSTADSMSMCSLSAAQDQWTVQGLPPAKAEELDLTLGGHLHWVSVMKDKKWEVLLG